VRILGIVGMKMKLRSYLYGGVLYNWYAIDPLSNGNKNVCPTGWHVPTDEGVDNANDLTWERKVAGGKMKEQVLHIGILKYRTTNESGFCRASGGFRNLMVLLLRPCYWIASGLSSMSEDNNVWASAPEFNNDNVHKGLSSVRCPRD
jgi:uncharacterized protein (TIGR02145 family)